MDDVVLVGAAQVVHDACQCGAACLGHTVVYHHCVVIAKL